VSTTETEHLSRVTAVGKASTPIQGAAALVRGGIRGFGRSVVEELFDRGAANVYAAARSSQTPPGKRIVPLVLDVTDDDSVAAAAQAAAAVSIVVNNAGISLNTPVLDAPAADIRAELETSLFESFVSVGRSRPSSPAATQLARHRPVGGLMGSRSARAMRSPRQPHGLSSPGYRMTSRTSTGSSPQHDWRLRPREKRNDRFAPTARRRIAPS
jgi:NAD(P)-dependent dehydrogenase (short-subunit alcohol dehydrogenase family)